MESKVSKALIDNEISHEDFMAILNEEKNDEQSKRDARKGINEVIKRNETIHNSLK